MGFETDETKTGFSFCIISLQKNGKTYGTLISRLTAGKPLEIASNDDMSDIQINAIGDVLDKLP